MLIQTNFAMSVKILARKVTCYTLCEL